MTESVSFADPRDVDAYVNAFSAFVGASPTSFHAVAEGVRLLASAGFVEVDEAEAWPNGPGRFVVRRDGGFVAWVVPVSAVSTTPWRVLGAHTDSPSLRLKSRDGGFSSHGWAQDSVEVYGGPILASWFDRDLEFAGRLQMRDGSERLVRSGAVARVPHLAPHLDRSINDAFSPDREAHLQPVLGVGDVPGGVVGLLAQRNGVEAADVRGADVFAVDAQAPARIGANAELLASPRLDNLVSVFAAVTALVGVPDDATTIAALAAFDHEEVGSESRSGAAGSLLEDVWVRVAHGLGGDADDVLRARAGSWIVSMDVGHVVHPNYSAKHDPRIQPVPGGGVLLKVNANQRYSTDGRGEAFFAAACESAGVDYQVFVSNNAVPCGSTIGPFVATRLGISTVDVGAGVLSMHSARELIHVGDLAALARAAVAAVS